MRNLKKVLALTLVLALAFSLATQGFAVSSKELADFGEITPAYQPAVDMLYELSIMKGFPDGEFKPVDSLTRAQYLKMLYVVMNRGNDDLGVLYNNIDPFPFSDIYGGSWFEGYVKWAYSRNYVAGKTATIFDPNGNVTGFEALKMSLVALGYDQDSEGFVGANWKINVLNRAQDAALLLNLVDVNMDLPLTREVAAQILQNTLFSEMVHYNTTFIPPRIEKQKTMAYTYYRLDTLTVVPMANDWASVDGNAKCLDGESRFLLIASNAGVVNANSYWNADQVTLKYNIPLEYLGKEVLLYVRERTAAVQGTLFGSYDYVYGAAQLTGKSQTYTAYARANIVDTDVTAAGNNGNVGFYFIGNGGGGLNKGANWTTVDTEWTFNYRNTYDGWTMDGTWTLPANEQIAAGGRFEFIDTDRNGKIDFVVAVSFTYAKVSVADDGKITAVSGGANAGFTTTKRIDGKPAAEVYLGIDGEALKNDDRVLVYPINDRNGVILRDATAGTLTASRSDERDDTNSWARISTVERYASRIPSRFIGSIRNIVANENFNAEKEYYYDLEGRMLEGPTYATPDSAWAVVKDSYIDNNLMGSAAKVSLLFADGKSGVYDVEGVYYGLPSDRNAPKYTLTRAGARGGDNSQIHAERAGASTIELFGEDMYMVQVILSSDEKTASLYYTDGARENRAYLASRAGGAPNPNTNDESNLAVTNAFLGLTAANVNTMTFTKNDKWLGGGVKADKAEILDGTVIFVRNDNLATVSWGVYKGRTLPGFVAGDVTGIRYSLNATGQLYDAFTRMALNGAIATGTVTNRNYGVVIGTTNVEQNANGQFYFIINVYNGTTVVELKGAPTVRADNSTYTLNNIGTPLYGLDGNGHNIGMRTHDVIEYSLNAAGEISSVARLDNIDNLIPSDSTNVAPINPNAFNPVAPTSRANSYVGYAAFWDSGFLYFLQGDQDPIALAGERVYTLTDNRTKWHTINGNSSEPRTAPTSFTNLNPARKVVIITDEEGYAAIVYVFSGDSNTFNLVPHVLNMLGTAAPTLTANLLRAIGITGVIDANIADYQAGFAAWFNADPDYVKVVADVQKIVTDTNASVDALTLVRANFGFAPTVTWGDTGVAMADTVTIASFPFTLPGNGTGYTVVWDNLDDSLCTTTTVALATNELTLGGTPLATDVIAVDFTITCTATGETIDGTLTITLS